MGAARRQFTRGRGRAGAPRATSWISLAQTFASISGAGTILNSATAALLASRPFTVIRSHLEV